VDCRAGCGACCIAPSISEAIPGMAKGKPAGVRCVQLSAENRCRLFASPDRPTVCSGFKASPDICGNNRLQAMHRLEYLERMTSPQQSVLVPLKGFPK